jgi:hypothetical protein
MDRCGCPWSGIRYAELEPGFLPHERRAPLALLQVWTEFGDLDDRARV